LKKDGGSDSSLLIIPHQKQKKVGVFLVVVVEGCFGSSIKFIGAKSDALASLCWD
jgi:hypothetical protein